MHVRERLFLASFCLTSCERPSPPPTEPSAAEAVAPASGERLDEDETGPAANLHAHRHRGGHHRFEDAEAWAEHFDDPARDAWQKPDEVLRFIDLPPNATVVDIGAGTGYFAVRLARATPKGTVLASDVEPDMVRYLGERASAEGLDNLIAVQGRADDPGVERPVDVAFLCNVYHHIEDPVALFRRVREHLVPKGRVVIVDFDPEAPEDAPGPPKAMRVSADDISLRLRDAGLAETRRDTTTLPYQYILELTPTDS